MPRRPRRRRAVLAALLLLGPLGACTSSPDSSQPLPDGQAVVTGSADALAALRSVHFDLTLSGTVPGLEVREVTGDATVDGGGRGSAAGSADVQAASDRFEYDYVLSGDRIYLTDQQHGGRSEQPMPREYTPGTVIGRDGGLRKLLTAATGLRTETRETLQEVPTYRVTGKLAAAVVSSVVPGIQSDVDVKFWVSQAPDRELCRMWMQIPQRQVGEGAVMLELALSRHNQPVRVPPPPVS